MPLTWWFPKQRSASRANRAITRRLVMLAGQSSAVFVWSAGSPVMSKLERMPDILALRAASLDDPSLYKPAMDTFTDSAWHWDAMTVNSQKLPKGIAG